MPGRGSSWDGAGSPLTAIGGAGGRAEEASSGAGGHGCRYSLVLMGAAWAVRGPRTRQNQCHMAESLQVGRCLRSTPWRPIFMLAHPNCVASSCTPPVTEPTIIGPQVQLPFLLISPLSLSAFVLNFKPGFSSFLKSLSFSSSSF